MQQAMNKKVLIKFNLAKLIIVFLWLHIMAGCNAPDDEVVGFSAGNERQREQKSIRNVVVPLAPQTEHSVEIIQMAISLKDGSISLSEWWELEISNSEREKMIMAMFELDPELTISMVEPTLGDLRGLDIRRWLINAWAHTSPSDSYRWIRVSENINDRQRNLLMRHLSGRCFRHLANNAPTEPWLALLRDMRGNNAQSRAIAGLEIQLSEHLARKVPPGEALAMMESSGPLSSEGLHHLFQNAAEADVQATLDFLESRPEDMSAWFESGGDMVCARMLVARAPVEGFEWAVNRDDPASAERSVRAAVTAWLPLSAQAASAQVAELPRGRIKDAAIGAMVEWLHQMKSTHEIEPWLDELSSDELKQNYHGLIEL